MGKKSIIFYGSFLLTNGLHSRSQGSHLEIRTYFPKKHYNAWWFSAQPIEALYTQTWNIALSQVNTCNFNRVYGALMKSLLHSGVQRQGHSPLGSSTLQNQRHFYLLWGHSPDRTTSQRRCLFWEANILLGKICLMEGNVGFQTQTSLLPVAHKKSVKTLLCVCFAESPFCMALTVAADLEDLTAFIMMMMNKSKAFEEKSSF